MFVHINVRETTIVQLSWSEGKAAMDKLTLLTYKQIKSHFMLVLRKGDRILPKMKINK